jgi:putative ABC transport system permease protein
METLLQDIRYSFRTMLKSPGFTAVAILSLAIGIGANTSIFSAINAVLLRPLPFAEPDRLMTVDRTSTSPVNPISPWSYPKFEALCDNNEVFEQVAAVSSQSFPLTDTDNPERLQVEMVSASYFPMLGVEAFKGRTFAPEEDQTPGTHPVILIGHGLWERRFGSDPGVIGQTVSLNKIRFNVLGILPEGFKGQSGSVEAWVPMMMAPQLTFPRRLKTAGAHWHDVIARLKPGTSPAEAQASMEVMNPQVAAANPGQDYPEAIRVAGLRESKIDPAISKSLLMLFGAVGLVLLIACVNIANLLLAKSASRQKEIAIRLALGASRARLIRQLLTESVLLAFIGGVVGLLLALWGIEMLTAINPMSDPASRARYNLMRDFNVLSIDAQVLAFNFAISFITGLLFGLVPAWQSARRDLNEGLKEAAGVSAEKTGRLRGFSFRSVLVVFEIAVSIMLLVGAGLMIKSFARLQATRIGFNPDNVLTAKIGLPGREYEGKASAFFEQLLDRVKSQPGVDAASVSISTPLSSNSSKAVIKIEGRPTSEGDEPSAVGYHIIGPEHFDTLRIPVLRGRAFTDQDRKGAKRVAIINDAAARRLWPDEEAIGKRIWLSMGWEKNDFAEIVGVVGDVKYRNVEQAVEPDVYIPYQQTVEEAPSFVLIRTGGNPAAMVAGLRREVLALDKNVPIYDVKTLEERSRDATSRARFTTLLLGIFAAMALLLSGMGIYGVMSYTISKRTREIGIRMALGAQRIDVLKLVLSDGIALTIIGIVVGLMASLAVTRLLTSQLYGVEATDPATFAVVSLILAAVALAASYIPARRATRVDPMVALRHE